MDEADWVEKNEPIHAVDKRTQNKNNERVPLIMALLLHNVPFSCIMKRVIDDARTKGTREIERERDFVGNFVDRLRDYSLQGRREAQGRVPPAKCCFYIPPRLE